MPKCLDYAGVDGVGRDRMQEQARKNFIEAQSKAMYIMTRNIPAQTRESGPDRIQNRFVAVARPIDYSS